MDSGLSRSWARFSASSSTSNSECRKPSGCDHWRPLAAFDDDRATWGTVRAQIYALRGDAATNPFYAAQKLVEAVGATSERRESLGTTSNDR